MWNAFLSLWYSQEYGGEQIQKRSRLLGLWVWQMNWGINRSQAFRNCVVVKHDWGNPVCVNSCVIQMLIEKKISVWVEWWVLDVLFNVLGPMHMQMFQLKFHLKISSLLPLSSFVILNIYMWAGGHSIKQKISTFTEILLYCDSLWDWELR